MTTVWYNGEWANADNLRITSDNRGLLYGDGLFETMRCKNGKPLFLDLHFERLKHGLSVLKLKTENITKEFLENKIAELNKRNSHQFGSRIRLVITRNPGATYSPNENTATLLITSQPCDDYRFSWPESGLQVDVYSEIKKPINALSSFKNCNSLIYILASVDYKNKNLNDQLILNERNEICEGTSSNIFWIKNNQTYTTPLTAGCVNGVLRQVLINLLNVQEKSLSEKELIEADEAFLSNMGTGIRWIRLFRNKEFTHSTTKEIINLLNKKLEAYE